MRPEAARREALALASSPARSSAGGAGARHEAEPDGRVTAALDRAAGRVEPMRPGTGARAGGQLPARVELPRSAAPSAARRLRRAGARSMADRRRVIDGTRAHPGRDADGG